MPALKGCSGQHKAVVSRVCFTSHAQFVFGHGCNHPINSLQKSDSFESLVIKEADSALILVPTYLSVVFLRPVWPSESIDAEQRVSKHLPHTAHPPDHHRSEPTPGRRA